MSNEDCEGHDGTGADSFYLDRSPLSRLRRRTRLSLPPQLPPSPPLLPPSPNSTSLVLNKLDTTLFYLI